MPKNCARFCQATRFDQPQVRFVNERGRLQGMVGAFPPQVCRSAPLEFAIYEPHERVPGLGITASPGLQ
jgi:hypothetical protein